MRLHHVAFVLASVLLVTSTGGAGPRGVKGGAASAGGDHTFRVTMAALMMTNQDDDLNVSWYAKGLMDGLIMTGAVKCQKGGRPFGEITSRRERERQEGHTSESTQRALWPCGARSSP